MENNPTDSINQTNAECTDLIICQNYLSVSHWHVSVECNTNENTNKRQFWQLCIVLRSYLMQLAC